MNYTLSPGIAVPKDKQLYNDRKDKLTQKQKGAISPKVRREVEVRSKGICEVRIKCKGAVGVHMAHLTGRLIIDQKTAAKDLKHSCVHCHAWLDQTAEGVYHKRIMSGRVDHEMQNRKLQQTSS